MPLTRANERYTLCKDGIHFLMQDVPMETCAKSLLRRCRKSAECRATAGQGRPSGRLRRLGVLRCKAGRNRTQGAPSLSNRSWCPHLTDGPRGGLRSSDGVVAKKGDPARIDFTTKRHPRRR
jgi:hypothetical protein